MNRPCLIIVASAPCARDDITSLPATFSFDWLAVGVDAVPLIDGEMSYVATYHPEDIPVIRDVRKTMGGNLDYRLVCHVPKEGVDIVIPFEAPSGSSALLGVLAGLRDDYHKMILCGCPLEGQSPQKNNYADFRKGWEAKFDMVREVVRSMSGWTKNLLGPPTEEWLNG
jgi:hypothetical protein